FSESSGPAGVNALRLSVHDVQGAAHARVNGAMVPVCPDRIERDGSRPCQLSRRLRRQWRGTAGERQRVTGIAGPGPGDGTSRLDGEVVGAEEIVLDAD